MIETFNYFFPYKNVDKTIHVYLPPNYNTEEQYPVMYMYDGHNLFSDEQATYGTSWGPTDFLDSYDKPMIIVGIECTHEGNERLAEYSPYNIDTHHWGHIDGYGDSYMEWLVHDLKPYIDQRYSTNPFREATGIAGSSMGGLMAFYSVMAYNQYFSKAACLSPALAFCQNQLEHEWHQSTIDPNTRVYFSFGKNEVKRNEAGLHGAGHFNDLLVENGSTSYIHVQSPVTHNERTWRKQNQLYLDLLWKW